MSDVVVLAGFAERIPAALQLAISTNRRSAVTALRHGSLAAWEICQQASVEQDPEKLNHRD